MVYVYFTRTELKILEFLADGQRHSNVEIAYHLDPDVQVERGTISSHVSNIRRKLEIVGQSIVCEVGAARRTYYRRVVLYQAPES